MIPDRKHDSVAIIGFTQHQLKAPWTNPEWAMWGLNDLHQFFEGHSPGIFASGRVEWFQLHRDEWGTFPGARDDNHTKWLAEQTIPIWMWEHREDIPSSLAYPMRDIMRKAVLPHGKPMSEEAYFNNSISWMIALAILRGFKRIGIYGVDMALDGVHGESEYSWQRPSVEYFVGVARGMGIDVVMPMESEICKASYLYGYDNILPARRKFLDRLEQLAIQDQQTSNDYEALKRALHETRGALGVLRGLQSSDEETTTALQTQRQDLENRELAIVNDYEASKRAIHEIRGARNNLLWVVRNYFPGEGTFHDLPRSPRSLVEDMEIIDLAAYPVMPDQSDGQRPINRIEAALKKKPRLIHAP